MTDIVVRTRTRAPRPDAALVLLADPTGEPAARFRALRRRLLERGDPATVLVTSPLPGEGKTFVAANLALALAESRRHRVALVEANGRTPSLATRFDFDPGEHVCFFAQLDEHRQRAEAPWQPTAVGHDHHLHVLAASRPNPNATIDPSTFRAAAQRLRQDYDYLVIDGPPVLSGPEVTLIEDTVDAFVLVARAGRTRGRALRESLEQILPAAVAGLVLVD